MLTFDELNRELNRYSYRPGWMLTLWYDPYHGGPILYVVADVENSYQPGSTTELRIVSQVPLMQNPDQFGDWLFWRLREIEVHECMEWFRKDGTVVHNPHDEQDPPMKDVKRVWARKQMQSVQVEDPGRESPEVRTDGRQKLEESVPTLLRRYGYEAEN